jgi:D-alanine-D-alanine ligase
LTEPINLRIAVIYGGRSAEAEVSRRSASAVSSALMESFRAVEQLELGDPGIHVQLFNGHFDVVFPMLHGPPGEDGTFQGYLEILGLPYVGSGIRASANAMHKPTAKLIYEMRGLPIVPGLTLEATVPRYEAAKTVVDRLGGDVVVKPCGQGSAIGVSFAEGHERIQCALDHAFEYDDEVLVEKRVRGREITAGVLEDSTPHAMPIIEVTTAPGFWYDYEHRYTPGLSCHTVPAQLPEDITERIQALALGAHRALGCRDLSRSDFIVTDSGDVYLLETNTLPGMTSTSLFPDAARAFGLAFPELVKLLVKNAWRRKAKIPQRTV